MIYQDALKAVRDKKDKDHFIVLELSYDKKLILPYNEGMALITTLHNAEQLIDEWNKTPRIVTLDRKQISIGVLPREEYELIKIAALMGVTLDEVKEHQAATA